MFFLVCGVISLLFGVFLIYAKSDRIKNAQPFIAKLVGIESKTVKTGGGIRKVYRAVVSYKKAVSAGRRISIIMSIMMTTVNVSGLAASLPFISIPEWVMCSTSPLKCAAG